jgi:hypothetical protein
MCSKKKTSILFERLKNNYYFCIIFTKVGTMALVLEGMQMAQLRARAITINWTKLKAYGTFQQAQK